MFGAQPSSASAFGSPAFGTPSSTPAFATPSPASAYGTPSSAPAFGTPSSTPVFGSGFGSSLFSTPQPQQQQQIPLFQQPTSAGFGFQTPFAAPQSTPAPQLTTQMAPVAPLPFSLADRDIQVGFRVLE